MLNNQATVLIVGIANPNKYPHLERHANSLLTKYSKVKVLCVGKQEEMPTRPNIEFICAIELMPQGISGFYKVMRSFYKKIKAISPDVVEAIDPPALAPAALAKKKGRDFHLVYMSMEHYTEQFHIKNSFKRFVLWSQIESSALKYADKCATVSAGIANLLQKKYNKNFELIRNLPPQKQGLKKSTKFQKRIVYHGLMEPGRGLEELCAALSMSSWKLTIVGGGPLLDVLRNKYSNSIEFTGWLEYDESLKKICESDVGAVFIEGISLSLKHCLPGKLFEYAQLGLPVLVSDLPEIKEMVNNYKIGEVTKFNKESIFEALKSFEDGISKNIYDKGLERAKNELCWEREEENFLNLFSIEST
jgi:glycosyltransferase involved in cell wall biosynthesis